MTNLDAPLGSPVTAQDSADDFGSAPAVTLVKDINGQHEPKAPGLQVPVGSTVTFTYLITNTGDVTLSPVALTDNILGTISCPQTSLAANKSETCTKTTTARAGTVTNVGTVSAQAVDPSGQPVGAAVSTTDAATYTGEAISTSSATAGTTTTTTVAPASATSPAESSPNGLGEIGTDLGRWTQPPGTRRLASSGGHRGGGRRHRTARYPPTSPPARHPPATTRPTVHKPAVRSSARTTPRWRYWAGVAAVTTGFLASGLLIAGVWNASGLRPAAPRGGPWRRRPTSQPRLSPTSPQPLGSA